MTHLIDKDALVAEINQRIEDYKSHKIDDSYHSGLIFALKDLRDDFINSLQEEPVSEDLEEASHNYAESEEKRVGCGTEFFTPELAEAFKAGSQWQKEQFEKNRLAACDAQTKEEAEREMDFAEKIIMEEHRQPTYSDAIGYGMRKMKQQMMKNAMEGTMGFTTIRLDSPNYGEIFKEGDKVKLIVIKEEQTWSYKKVNGTSVSRIGMMMVG